MIIDNLTTKRINWAVFGVLFFALILRLTSIFYGLPHPGYFSSDEIDVISRTLKIMSGDLAPTHLNKPMFYNIISAISYSFAYMFYLFAGVENTREYFIKSFIVNPSIFYLFARMISAISSYLTVFLCYKLSRRLAGHRSALLSACICAVCFTTVRMAHIAKEDSLMTLMILVGAYFSMSCKKSDRRYSYYLSVAFIGLATAAKYTAALALVFPITLFVIEAVERAQIKNITFKIIMTPVIFMVAFGFGMPYFLLHTQDFINGILASKIFEQVRGDTIWLGGERHYGIIFILKMIYEEYGFLLGIAVFISIISSICYLITGYRKTDESPDKFQLRACLQMLLFVLLSLVVFMISGHLDYHYIIPLTPFLAILISINLEKIFYKKSASFIALLMIIILSQPFIKTVKFDIETLGEDTRIKAAKWIESYISPDNKLIFDTEYFYQYHPPIKINPQSVEELHRYAVERGGSGAYYNLLRKHSDFANSYISKFLPMPTWISESSAKDFKEYDLLKIRADGYSYMICSGYYFDRIIQEHNPAWNHQKNFYSLLKNECKIVYKIKPAPYLNKGPEIFIFKLK